MKKYLAIYLANPAAGDNETVNFSTEMRQQGMQAWTLDGAKFSYDC